MTQTTLNPYEIAVLAANLAESKKALDTMVLDTGKVSYLSDYFVICSGESAAQLRAIADGIVQTLGKLNIRPHGQERDKMGKWFLLDYGDVVIHVMNRQERQYYQLEQFWNHANVISKDLWLKEERQAS